MKLLYRQKLGLESAQVSLIEHEDAIVATVYHVKTADGKESILKICFRPCEYYREVFFLTRFASKLPVPRIIRTIPPEKGIDGAVLMECLPGNLLTIPGLTSDLTEKAQGYGDLVEPNNLSSDPRHDLTLKFEEGLGECAAHFSKEMIEKCRRFFMQHRDLFLIVDGPCIIHRDYRPGNIFAKEGKLTGIIDWASARGGFAKEDFCPLELGDWSEDPQFKKAFLTGYATVRPIPDYERIMPLLLLSRAIAVIGFTVKRGTWNSKCKALYQRHLQSIQSLFRETPS